jgi:hypothetical protein
MADAGLFVGFSNPVRGREKQAIAVFNEFVEFLGQQQGGGAVESFEPVFLEPHGGDLGGFFLVRGDAEKLGQIRGSDEFIRLTSRAQLIVEGFGVVSALLGDAIGSQMALYQEQIDDLT